MKQSTVTVLAADARQTMNERRCTGIDDCSIYEDLHTLLSEVKNEDGDFMGYSENYRVSDIMDKFYHCLLCHDHDQEFMEIYGRLNRCDKNSCKYYLRNNRRRMKHYNYDEPDQEEIVNDNDEHNLLRNMTDKLHVYYYHSIDTFGRGSIFDVDDRKQDLNDTFMSNKFNSNFSMDDEKENEEQTNVYSFGYRFNYINNNHELFVSSKYGNMKDELTNNEISCITNAQYQNEHDKAMEFLQTQYVRSLRSKFQQISVEHILALLTYCNYDQYQNKWSESFRKLSSNESMKSLKDRHSHFVCSSINLINLIEEFGVRLFDEENSNKRFYHGVNRILYFSKTIAKFNGPLSTSSEILVAHNFSAGSGLVLEFKYTFSQFPLRSKYFDCAPFSDFPAEKECLFIGGLPNLMVTNIINISNDNEEYRQYMTAINIMNAIFQGTYHQKDTDEDVFIVTMILLIQFIINKDNDIASDYDDIPQYIKNLMINYCNNLQHIVILWHNVFGRMNEINEDLLNIISDDDETFFDINILSKLMPNLEQIEYYNNTLNKQELVGLTESITANADSMYVNSSQTMQYIIIHHDKTSINNAGGVKSVLSQSSQHGVLLLNGMNDSVDWEILHQTHRILIAKSNSSSSVDNIHYHYNDIKQGFTSINILKNLT